MKTGTLLWNLEVGKIAEQIPYDFSYSLGEEFNSMIDLQVSWCIHLLGVLATCTGTCLPLSE